MTGNGMGENGNATGSARSTSAGNGGSRIYAGLDPMRVIASLRTVVQEQVERIAKLEAELTAKKRATASPE